MNDPFDMFYTKTAEIAEINEPNGYSDRQKNIRSLGTIKCDIQPYSGGESSRNEILEAERGLCEMFQLRLFSAADERICVGNYVLYKGRYYRIAYTAEWEFGYQALLQERDNGNIG